MGDPGAGKSTLLARIIWELAQKAQRDETALIPVLVELKSYQSTGDRRGIRSLIQSSLEMHDPALDDMDLQRLLREKRLLLLVDGINELPDERVKTELKNFYLNIPPIATTRNAGSEGIERKLELQPLTSMQVAKFLEERLPNCDRAQLQKLGDRAQDLGQMPLMIWMLYSIFQTNKEIPETRGEAYRAFTTLYTERAKEGALRESRTLLRGRLR